MIDNQTIEDVARFHGHMCAGLAMGIKAADIALGEIGPNAPGQEVVAVVESDFCGVDAIQFLTGCTFGKGNLRHEDNGKNAYTFFRRSDRRAIRVSMRSGGWGPRDPEWEGLMAKMRADHATEEERSRFTELRRDRSDRVLAMSPEDLYEVRDVEAEPPRAVRVYVPIDCDSCAEPTMETRIRRLDGRSLCGPCFDRELAGVAPVSFRAPGTRRSRSSPAN